MKSTFRKFVVQPIEDGYCFHEIMVDNYQVQKGEIFLSLEERPISGFYDQTYVVEFLVDTEFIEINKWKLPKSLVISTHHPGTFSRTSFNAICISPDGLKVEINYLDESKSMCCSHDVINLILSKLWITSCKTAKELNKHISINFRNNKTYSEVDLVKMLKSVAELSKKINSYKHDQTNEIDVIWALKKEYEYRLEKLLKIVS
jgi:hypothetical protein